MQAGVLWAISSGFYAIVARMLARLANLTASPRAGGASLRWTDSFDCAQDGLRPVPARFSVGEGFFYGGLQIVVLHEAGMVEGDAALAVEQD
jgi:hypothetical protein